MLKRFATLLTLLTALFLFNACDDAPQITKPIIDEILTDPIPVTQSRYTGGLQRIGTVKNFGINIKDPIAIEWNGKSLYMLADHGRDRNEAQYLFKVDPNTGSATFVNRGAINLGGTFHGGRNFTQVGYVSPKDMTWIPHTQEMIAICPVLDAIVSIDIETGLAGRITGKDDFCLRTEDGYRVLGAGNAISFDGLDFYMIGTTQYSVSDGRPFLAQLFQLSDNLRCAIPLTDNPPIQFDVSESNPYALCSDGEHLYMSGGGNQALYIMNRQTGVAYLIAHYHFTPMPEGFSKHPNGNILNMTDPEYPQGIVAQIQVTGLAFDGTDMFAVESFTNGLYKLEKR